MWAMVSDLPENGEEGNRSRSGKPNHSCKESDPPHKRSESRRVA